MTVHECAGAAARILMTAGFSADDARRDAAVLARHVLTWTTAEWAARLRDDAPPDLDARLAALATRRASHEPVAYITGTRGFYGRLFRVTPAVLIPRPETEGVIAEALRTGPGPVVIDVGTGSGCLAVTLALEWPEARVIATDISPESLKIAADNARALGAGRVKFALVGPADFIPPNLPAADLIVSNPPYVAERDRTSLPPDVRDFEPAAALFAGEDGLDVIRRLLPAARPGLKPGGVLVIEFGAGQSQAVTTLAAAAGLAVEVVRPDLQGIPRVLVARRPAG